MPFDHYGHYHRLLLRQLPPGRTVRRLLFRRHPLVFRRPQDA